MRLSGLIKFEMWLAVLVEWNGMSPTQQDFSVTSKVIQGAIVYKRNTDGTLVSSLSIADRVQKCLYALVEKMHEV